MNLLLLIIVFSIGNIRETFARSVVVSSAVGVQDPEAANGRLNQNDLKQISGNEISYLVSKTQYYQLFTQHPKSKSLNV